MTDPTRLAELIREKFISRDDVKAIQNINGSYQPVTSPFTTDDLVDHLMKRRTYGHYVLGTDSTCKVITFDFDLNETGFWIEPITIEEIEAIEDVAAGNADIANAAFEEIEAGNRHDGAPIKQMWLEVGDHPDFRDFMKLQMRTLVETVTSRIRDLLDVPVAAAYSGHKGVHVYAFLPEPMPGRDARLIAADLMESFGYFTPNRGDNFWQDQRTSTDSFSNFTCEVFPKQDAIEAGKYGNLVRLPLGRNMKANHPAFFIDQTKAHVKLSPHPDPIALLESGNPWA